MAVYALKEGLRAEVVFRDAKRLYVLCPLHREGAGDRRPRAASAEDEVVMVGYDQSKLLLQREDETRAVGIVPDLLAVLEYYRVDDLRETRRIGEAVKIFMDLRLEGHRYAGTGVVEIFQVRDDRLELVHSKLQRYVERVHPQFLVHAVVHEGGRALPQRAAEQPEELCLYRGIEHLDIFHLLHLLSEETPIKSTSRLLQ